MLWWQVTHLTCSTNRGKDECIQDIGGKARRKRPLGRSRHRWLDNIKIDLRGQDGVVRTGLICLRIGTNGGLLWTWQETFGFHKMLGNSWVASQLAAFQKELSSMESVITVFIFSPNKLASLAWTKSWCVPLNFNPPWCSWTYLMVHSKAKLKSNADKAPPCFRPLWIGDVSHKCLPTQTLLLLISFRSIPNSIRILYNSPILNESSPVPSEMNNHLHI
jgi:hypothetical protein